LTHLIAPEPGFDPSAAEAGLAALLGAVA